MSRSSPIFVVGAARSGTTLLQSSLGAHPRIAAPPELYFIARIASLADYYGDLTEDLRLEQALRATLDLPVLESIELDEKDLLDTARASPRTYGALMAVVMTAIASSWGKPRWSDKSPWQRPPAIWGLFPDAQVVHVIRDPRDVIASSVEAPWILESPLELARTWKRFNMEATTAGGQAGPSRYHRVRYEDVVRDPEIVLRGICAFLGEDFDDAMLDPSRRGTSGTVADAAAPWQSRVAHEIDTSSVGRHQALPIRQRVLVAAALRHELAPLGYDPPRMRAVVAGLLARPLEAPRDVRRATRYMKMRRRLAPHQRHAAVQEMIAEGLRRTSTTGSRGD